MAASGMAIKPSVRGDRHQRHGAVMPTLLAKDGAKVIEDHVHGVNHSAHGDGDTARLWCLKTSTSGLGGFSHAAGEAGGSERGTANPNQAVTTTECGEPEGYAPAPGGRCSSGRAAKRMARRSPAASRTGCPARFNWCEGTLVFVGALQDGRRWNACYRRRRP